MGKISSPVEAIKKTQFFRFPRTPIQARIARSGDVVVALSKSGRVYTNVALLSILAYCDGCEDWVPNLFECMRALDLLTPADIERHTRYAKAENHFQKMISLLGDTKRWADHPVLRTSKGCVMGAAFKTVSEVRAANIAAGGRFFSRQNMSHVGDTLRSFALWREPQGELFLYRKPSATVKLSGFRDDDPYVRQVGFDPHLGAFWLIRSNGRMVPMGSEAKKEFYIRLKKEAS